MKILQTFTLLFLLISCGRNKTASTEELITQKNVTALEQKRSDLVNQIDALSNELDIITDAIDRIDTTKKRALVTVMKLEPAMFKHKTSVQSIIKTDQNLALQPEFMGAVASIEVVEGQQVSKGQVLIRIDDGGLADNVKLQQAQTDLAKTVFERQKKLWDQEIGSEIEFLQAQTNYESQRNMLAQLQDQLEKAVLKAPFSGQVDDIMVEVGEVVSPGQTSLLRLVSTNEMYVEADVPETYLPSVQKGTEVIVDVPVLNTSFESKITHRAKHINTENRTFRVTAAVDASLELSPNLISALHIYDYINPKALLVPLSIVSENAAGDEFVYTVDKNNKAQKIFIQTGRNQDEFIEVVSGLEAGAVIIDEGARLVKENQPVQIINSL
ncbi:MAG: efflux RND transporter periplasmic adaptor subunit [Flavobacteriaceae bacterium]